MFSYVNMLKTLFFYCKLREFKEELVFDKIKGLVITSLYQQQEE